VGFLFWLPRFLAACAVAFLVLASAKVALGQAPMQAVVHAAIWGPVTAVVYIAVAIRRSRLCRLRQTAPDPQ
jgi:hypothetical protein